MAPLDSRDDRLTADDFIAYGSNSLDDACCVTESASVVPTDSMGGIAARPTTYLEMFDVNRTQSKSPFVSTIKPA